MINRYKVGSVGRRITIGNLAPEPELSSREALELAAWLVATAAPLVKVEPDEVLRQFMGMVAAAGDEELAAAVARELSE